MEPNSCVLSGCRENILVSSFCGQLGWVQYIILVLRLRVSKVFHRQHNRMDGCVLNPQETCGGSSSELATPLTFMEEVVQRVNGGSWQDLRLRSPSFPGSRSKSTRSPTVTNVEIQTPGVSKERLLFCGKSSYSDRILFKCPLTSSIFMALCTFWETVSVSRVTSAPFQLWRMEGWVSDSGTFSERGCGLLAKWTDRKGSSTCVCLVKQWV